MDAVVDRLELVSWLELIVRLELMVGKYHGG